MPPLIALSLCLFFIAAAFYYDTSHRPKPERGGYLALLWLLMVGGKPVSGWLGMEASSHHLTEGSPLDRNITLVLMLLALRVLYKRRSKIKKIVRGNYLVFLLFAFAGISILWSDFPFVTLKRWIKGFGPLLFALIILSDQTPLNCLRWVLRRWMYVVVSLSIVLIKYFPNLGRAWTVWEGTTSFRGAAMTKNGLGIICMISLIYLFWEFWVFSRKGDLFAEKAESKGLHADIIVFAGLTCWLLALADSATSILCSLVGIVVIVSLEGSWIKMLMRASLWKTGMILAVLSTVIYSSRAWIVTILGRDLTLTGRVDIWNELLAMPINPILGTGYDSFWLGERLAYFTELYYWMPNQAHNGYIETYINLGLIGLGLLVFLIGRTFRNLTTRIQESFGLISLTLAFFFTILVHNITEASFFKGMSPLWFFFLLIVFVPSAVQIHAQEKGIQE